MSKVSEQLINLEQSGMRMNALAVMAGINPSLMHRMRHGTRPCSFENALKIHVVTKGRFSVEQTHPEALRLVRRILKEQGVTGTETQQDGTEASNSSTEGAVQCEPAPEHSAAA